VGKNYTMDDDRSLFFFDLDANAIVDEDGQANSSFWGGAGGMVGMSGVLKLYFCCPAQIEMF
jgi:hypothetical protein